MNVVLTQSGLKKALDSKLKKTSNMTDEQWEELDEKALSALQLCLSKDVLREVIHKTSVLSLYG